VEELDCVVIGAGVVGLAVARSLALDGREVVILEANDAIGRETSSRNSEVIHAGIYYPAGSLKAQLCVEGKQRLYRYCAERDIAHARCGKLIVATSPQQEPQLEHLLAQARANGVDDLQRLSEHEAVVLEPALRCCAALLSPSTGIVDSHGLMLALQGEAEQHGASLALKSPVLHGRVGAAGIELDVGGDEPMTVRAHTVVNSAGLSAPRLAASLDGFPRSQVPPSYLCKGNYFALPGKAAFKRLIYPVPEAAGLGVHVTLDLAGQMRFGPDAQWIDELDYHVDPKRADVFYAAIRRYWPALPGGALQPSYSGVRPKIRAPHEGAQDFVIQGPAEHGVAGLVHLYGIESPGLTAALAIGEHVAALMRGSTMPA
jgi:L-2-hydroxyglutarate oxidase LhgO